MTAAFDANLMTSDSSDGSSRCYPAKLIRIIDADTLVVNIDLGFYDWRHDQRVRLMGVNAPEMDTPAGKAARDFVCGWFATHGQQMRLVTVKDRSHKDKSDSFGRYLAWVSVGGVSLNEELVKAGHAVEYRK